jgi:Fur family ferric uptake transcriptional regulator
MTGASEHQIGMLQDQLSAYMERKGLRSTTQRRLVSDVFFRTGGHLSIDEMLALVRTRDAKVGYATVYRTMKLLLECGLANERQFEDTVTRFEVAHTDRHHDHLICLQCRRIIEFEDAQIEHLQEAVARRHGYALMSHKHELYGLCERCQQPSHSPGARRSS